MSLDFFKDDGVFLPMLNDKGRNTFYKNVLELTAPGKVVCDVGAGTGFLSVLAVAAGASNVIAVEKNLERYQYLKENIKKIKLDNKIETVHADFLDTNIKADIYVSETINTQIFGEDILRLSNHVVKHQGKFIPSSFKIWAEVYEDHPIFVIDLTSNEFHNFNPGIDIDFNFVKNINQDFLTQYDLSKTLYRANQLNKLFQVLDRFTDLNLEKIGTTNPIFVDLNEHNIEDDIVINIPDSLLDSKTKNPMVVLHWQISCQDIVLNSSNCWFGNVAKPIHKNFSAKQNVEFRYNSTIRDWIVTY
jgi:predicted RNA methylase